MYGQPGYPYQQAPPQQPGYAPNFYMPPPPMGYQQPSPLQQYFQAVDRDMDGRINAVDLQQALCSCGFSFSGETSEKMIRMFDRDNTGTVDLNEFCMLHQFISSMQDGFRQRDTSREGRLQGVEVRAALAISGYQLAEGTFQTMMRKFDRHKCGSLGFDDYVELSIFISTVRNVFAFYDKQRTGQVTFNFDTFLTASVSTR